MYVCMYICIYTHEGSQLLAFFRAALRREGAKRAALASRVAWLEAQLEAQICCLRYVYC